jgi:hypothetical protein
MSAWRMTAASGEGEDMRESEGDTSRKNAPGKGKTAGESLFFAAPFAITIVPETGGPPRAGRAPDRPQRIGRHHPFSKGGVTVATSKQLQSKLDKLKSQIEQRSTQLATLRETQKHVKEQLASAKKAEKDKKNARAK